MEWEGQKRRKNETQDYRTSINVIIIFWLDVLFGWWLCDLTEIKGKLFNLNVTKMLWRRPLRGDCGDFGRKSYLKGGNLTQRRN